MREIKFRAWDKELNTLEYRDFREICNYGWILKDYFDNFIFMQYTGLKDKNDKEIWEGDIILYYYCPIEQYTGVVGVVKYKAPDFYLHSGEWRNQFVKKGQQEVIGNIYETPELVSK